MLNLPVKETVFIKPTKKVNFALTFGPKNSQQHFSNSVDATFSLSVVFSYQWKFHFCFYQNCLFGILINKKYQGGKLENKTITPTEKQHHRTNIKISAEEWLERAMETQKSFPLTRFDDNIKCDFLGWKRTICDFRITILSVSVRVLLHLLVVLLFCLVEGPFALC